MKRIAALAIGLAWPGPALAHEAAAGSEAPGWTLAPSVTVPLALTLLLYGTGFARRWARSGPGRPALAREAMRFCSGWAILAGALASPLHEAGERSFTMHMIEHELIMLPAALLMVLAHPLATLLWAFPAKARLALAGTGKRRPVAAAWRFLADPIVATVLQVAALWGWHAPATFDRALDSEGWHVAQHLSFLVTALLFWWAMVQPRRGSRGYGVSALCLFATSLAGAALGALMAFSASPWYVGYAAMGMTPIGLTPAEDQQLAGLIMWLPGGTVHLGAALVCLYLWINSGGSRHVVAAQ